MGILLLLVIEADAKRIFSPSLTTKLDLLHVGRAHCAGVVIGGAVSLEALFPNVASIPSASTC
jgi:hypothetical protein